MNDPLGDSADDCCIIARPRLHRAIAAKTKGQGTGGVTMSVLNDPPSIRRIDSPRPDLFAVEIAGHVSAADIENLYGLLEGHYTLHERVDLLIRIVDNEGVEWNAVSPDTVEEAKEHAKRHIVRCAVIGEDRATRRFADIFSSPEAETRHFAADEEDDAWEWLGEAQ
jgi:hypothetical protein